MTDLPDLARRLSETPLPDSDAAEERAWELVRSAYSERGPAILRRSHRRWTLVAALAVLAALAVVSATGAARDVIESLRRTVGIEHPRPALFALPSQGRLLITTTDGAWVVSPNGGKRYLGHYTNATWSPHGLYIAATKANELRAIEPDGDVRWTISRPHISNPRWSPSGFRISYLDQTGLRVVTGDGSSDSLLASNAARIPAAWKPGNPHMLAYATDQGQVVLVNTDAKRVERRTRPGPPVRKVAWSSDGRVLYVQRKNEIEIYRADRPWNAPWTGIRPTNSRQIADFAVRPGKHEVAVAFNNPQSGATEIICFPGSCRFNGSGTITPFTWTADGRWLFLDWPQANQLVFLRASKPPGIRAIANIRQQFTARSSPGRPGQILEAEWCCQ